MTLPERITIEQLTAIYEAMGFVRSLMEPSCFVREKDGLMFFHQPFEGRFYLAIVVDDIRNTEALYPEAKDIADRFLGLLPTMLPFMTDEAEK